MIGTIAAVGLAYKFLSGPSSSNEYLQTRQERKDKEMGPIATGAVAAAALTTLATKKPFGIQSSNFINRVRRTAVKSLRSMTHIRDNADIDRYSLSDWKKLYKNVKQAWRDSKSDISSGSIRLTREKFDKNFPLMTLIYDTKTRLNYSRMREDWIENKVLKPAIDKLETDYKRGTFDYNEKRSIEKFLKDSSKSIKHRDMNMNTLSKVEMNASAKQYALQQYHNMEKIVYSTDNSLGGPLDFTKYLKDEYDKARNIAKNVLTVDNMAEQAGIVTKEEIDKLDHHDTTVGELLKAVEDEAAARFQKTGKKEAPHLYIDDAITYKDPHAAPKSERFDIYSFLNRMRKEAQAHGDEELEKFLSIKVDAGNLYTDKKTGKIFSKEGINESYRDMLQFLRNTLPGQLLKVGDIENQFHFEGADLIHITGDPILAARLEKIGELDKQHFRFGQKVFTVGDNGALTETIDPTTGKSISEGLTMVSGRYGFYHGIIESLSGMSRTRMSDNALFRYFDINQDRENNSGDFISDITRRFFGVNERKKKFYGMLDEETYAGEFENVLSEYIVDKNTRHLFGGKEHIGNEAKEYGIEYSKQIKNIGKLFNENTYTLTEDTIDRISSYQYLTDESRKFWELLKKDNNELIGTLLEDKESYFINVIEHGKKKRTFLNKDLDKTISEYITDPAAARSKIELWSTELGESYGTSLTDLLHSPRGNQTAKFEDILRKQIEREAILRQGAEDILSSKNMADIDYDAINEMIENVDIGEHSRENLNKLAQSAIFQHDSKIWNLRGKTTSEEVFDEMSLIMEDTRELFTGKRAYQQKLQETYRDILGNEISRFEGSIDIDSMGSGTLNNTIFVNKSASVLDIVSGLNEAIKNGSYSSIGDSLSNIWGGLSASRSDLSGANLYTFVPYFGIKRLSDELNRVGLGFSSLYTESTASFAMAFMTKRVMPLAIGATYLDWMDDTTREATGTGLWEAFTKGAANVDLTGRRALSGLGMDEWLKAEKDINPIWQYWGDKDEYQGYDERREYYRNGYTPVRKAAWWTWGSVSEARGGEITYWEPNIVRRAESNYYDNSMYDGYWDKWSHSWLPTPTNPLSPLLAITDPYWLERKHSEDRPYPVSGPMFQDGTPWGVVLNPTIGAILKPEKELHPYRLRNGVDILALMRGINGSIKQWSDNWNRRNYIAVNGGDVSAINLNMFESPSDNSRLINITSHGGAIAVYGGNAPGVYGTGDRNQEGASWGTVGNDLEGLGNPVEMSGQDLKAGFNPIKNDRKAALHLLAGPEELSAVDHAREQIFGVKGARYVRNGEIIENTNGELGIYQDKPLGPPRGSYFTPKQKLEIDIVTSDTGRYSKETTLNIMNRFNPLDLIREVNDYTKQLSKQKVDNPYEIDEEVAFSTPAKLRSFRPSLTMDLLNDADTVSDLMNAGKGSDFVRSATTSIRLIGGIYGYMGSEAIGFGVYNGPKIATSSDMTSFTRSFWDLNLGGLGGSVSEIGRRFIPNFQRANKINPLMNNLPDWLPERFRYGDAYSAIPKGEMRLPGRGWESLNDYHSDMFSTEEDRTGAFDRFKILADIAPNSEEYKLWREIAKRTVTSPELIDEMEEIKNRARQQGKKHDFYDYNVVNKSLNYENVVVSEILGYGKFRSGSRIFKVAGVSVQGNAEENAQKVLNRYIHVGQEVTIATDANQYTGTNKDAQHTINAAVFVGGESISKMMQEAGDARERKGDTSAPAKLANLTTTQQALGYAAEVIGHLDIPIISDQWLRIRSPYESYLAEQVYGTPYMSWSHPINTVLKPAITRAIYTRSIMDVLINKMIFTPHGYRDKIPEINFNKFGFKFHSPEVKLGRDVKHFAFMGRLLSNRASLAGYGVANILSSGDMKVAHKFDRRFNEFVTAAHVLTGGRSMLDMAAMGAYLGDAAADFFSDVDKGKIKSHSKYALIGSLAAMGYRIAIGQAGKSWIPDSTRKKWEMEDYWDRLNYLKYRGLYEEAARRAEDEEGVDVKNVLENIDTKEKERSFALEQLEKIRKNLNEAYSFRTSPLKKHLLKMVNTRIRELDTDENVVEGGKYTQSAIVYKKAADSTMYGLKENASWSEIVTALPKNDRDYFMEFVSERDPEMRDKILETASPSLRRALLMAWGKNTKAPKSNEEFFKNHYLPDKDWVGWRPDVDLNDIEVKTIENEAMNLSDFGFYESSLRTPGARVAWGLPFHDRNSRANTAREIKKILNGEGIRNVEVDITDKNSMGPTDVIANIGVFLGLKEGKNKVNEALRAVEY